MTSAIVPLRFRQVTEEHQLGASHRGHDLSSCQDCDSGDGCEDENRRPEPWFRHQSLRFHERPYHGAMKQTREERKALSDSRLAHESVLLRVYSERPKNRMGSRLRLHQETSRLWLRVTDLETPNGGPAQHGRRTEAPKKIDFDDKTLRFSLATKPWQHTAATQQWSQSQKRRCLKVVAAFNTSFLGVDTAYGGEQQDQQSP